MGFARGMAGCALAAALCAACGGTKDDATTHAVDFVTLTIYGTTTTYSDSASNVSLMAYSSGGSTAVALGAPGVTFTLALPAGATGSVAGTVSTIVGGNSCSGPVTVNVTRHGTGLGGEVAGSFGPSSVPCPIGPTPATVSASFSVTHL